METVPLFQPGPVSAATLTQLEQRLTVVETTCPAAPLAAELLAQQQAAMMASVVAL